MDRINQERSELLTLFREGLLSKEALGEHLEQLANDSRRLKATLSTPPPAPPSMDEKHNDEPPAARASHKLTDADFDEVMGPLLADDEELEHKDAPEEHEEEELEEHKEGPTRFFHAEFVIQLFAQRADGTLRPGERRTIRGWAHLTDEQVDK